MDQDFLFAQYLNSLCTNCEENVKNEGYDLCQDCYENILPPPAEDADYETLLEWESRRNRHTDNVKKAERSTICDNFPSRKYKHNKRKKEKIESCLICIESYETGDSIMTLPCMHTYHEECIRKWILENPTCPVCTHNVRDNLVV